jgi:hypothetical protein
MRKQRSFAKDFPDRSIRPKATFRFDEMNGWEARESGPWLKAQEAQSFPDPVSADE